MIESKLEKIIKRLFAMTKDQSDDIQSRDFYSEGQLLAKAYFNHINGIFEVANIQTGEHFRFEILDLAAIEIYEILAESKSAIL